MDIPLDHHVHVTRHRHVRSCYWDHRQAGWVCPGEGLASVPVTTADLEDGARLTSW
ncbi:MAG TPA: hypothetical protein VFY76_04795 [Nocardioides sp.]|nr:hypothetical protein [Nocardioides sp.]